MAEGSIDSGMTSNIILKIATAIGCGTVSSILIYRLAKSSNPSRQTPRTIPSPRDTLIPFISSKEALDLPYSPDLLPGARDVGTQYGTMRVYEWGPEDGQKVVLVHGDTNPAPMLAPIAHALVARGCRVMMFGTTLQTAEHHRQRQFVAC